MSEYIEREAALLEIEEWADTFCECDYVWPHVIESISKLPAADVRPVVLCRDCKYYCKDADGYEMCDNSEGYDHVTEDGFCAWAVKREES